MSTLRIVRPCERPPAISAPSWVWSKGETKRRMALWSAKRWLNARVVPVLRWLERWGLLSLCGLAALAASLLYVSLPTPGLRGLLALLLLAGVALAVLGLKSIWLTGRN